MELKKKIIKINSHRLCTFINGKGNSKFNLETTFYIILQIVM